MFGHKNHDIFSAFRKALPSLNLLVFSSLIFIYSLISPFISAYIETKGVPLKEILDFHWSSGDSIFGAPIKIALRIILPFTFAALLYAKTGAPEFFRARLKVFFRSKNNFAELAGAVFARLFTGPAATIDGGKDAWTKSCRTLLTEIFPPILGMAAFLAAGFTGIPYSAMLIKILPLAFITLCAIFYIFSDFSKTGLIGLGKFFSLLFMLCITWFLPLFFPDATLSIFKNFPLYNLLTLFVIFYFLLLGLEKKTEKPLRLQGIYHFLPPLFLVLTLSLTQPEIAALYNIFLAGIILTISPFLEFLFDKKKNRRAHFFAPIKEIGSAVVETTKIMTPFTIAMALLGLVIGSFSISGLGPIIIYTLEDWCKNSLIIAILLALPLTFFLNLILKDMVFTFTLTWLFLAPVISDLAAQNSFPLEAATTNIFLLYLSAVFFALLPETTFKLIKKPGGQSLMIGIPTENLRFIIVFIALAFMIILERNLVPLNGQNFHHILFPALRILAGILVFAACMKGRIITRNSRTVTLLLLLIAFTILYPKSWINLAYPAYQTYSGDKIFEVAENLNAGEKIKILASGVDEIGENKDYVFLLPLGEGKSGEEKLRASGLYLKTRHGFAEIRKVAPGSSAEDLGFDPEFTIKNIGIPQPQPNRYLPLLPALLIFLAIIGWQSYTSLNFIAKD